MVPRCLASLLVLASLALAPPGLAQDFGDAPDPTYPTLLAGDGARHTLGGPFLGACVDAEADGQPSAQARGDDLLDAGAACHDDEDGVRFLTPLVPGSSAVRRSEDRSALRRHHRLRRPARRRPR